MKLRRFFIEREVWEVETPLLSHATVPDPFIESLTIASDKKRYLQTSPEFAMKRLLAAGSGSIFQITKAFRKEESGRQHNPEFTMLEWYRVGFDHHQLMQEMDALLQYMLHCLPAKKTSYQQLFLDHLNIDPLTATIGALSQCAKAHAISIESTLEKDDWLNLLMTHCIEPKLGANEPLFIYDYPASQSALAKLSQQDPRVAERFEVYYKGVELANGFHELRDAKEQRARFEKDNQLRQDKQLDQVPLDEFFLQALAHGLPDCAGVALGVDRLVMLALGVEDIKQVLSFDFSRA